MFVGEEELKEHNAVILNYLNVRNSVAYVSMRVFHAHVLLLAAILRLGRLLRLAVIRAPRPRP
jgi:hypothetical protein